MALAARSRDELERTAGGLAGESLVIPTDVTDAAQIEDMFATVEAAWGTVEVLVANAGVATSAPIARITDADWQAMLDVNLTAPFRCVRRAVPNMVANRFGRIIVIASVASKTGEPYTAAYTASKHGVLGLVRVVAAELATKGVTVNAVCPAFVDSAMTDGTIAGVSARTGLGAEEVRGLLAARQPIGRLITPQEVAATVSYLLDAAGVTGQGLNIDGGAIQS